MDFFKALIFFPEFSDYDNEKMQLVASVWDKMACRTHFLCFLANANERLHRKPSLALCVQPLWSHRGGFSNRKKKCDIFLMVLTVPSTYASVKK